MLKFWASIFVFKFPKLFQLTLLHAKAKTHSHSQPWCSYVSRIRRCRTTTTDHLMEIWDLLKMLATRKKHIQKWLMVMNPMVVYNPLKKTTKQKQFQSNLMEMVEFRMGKTLPSWWFQPIWKNISQNGNLPQIEVNIKNVWNHHLVTVIAGSQILRLPKSSESRQRPPPCAFHTNATGEDHEIPKTWRLIWDINIWAMATKTPYKVGPYQL